MKVAMITPFPEGDLKIKGGVAGVSFYLSRALLQEFPGLQLHVFAPSYSGRHDSETIHGISVHHIPMPKYLPAALANITVFRNRLFKELAAIDADIAHFQGAASWGYRYDKPKILTIHGIPEKDVLFQNGYCRRLKSAVLATFERTSRAGFEHTVIINKYVLELIGRHLGAHKHEIANPIDDGFYDIPRAEENPVILYGGVISRRKNVLGVLSTFRKVADAVPAAALWIAGTSSDPSYMEECKSYVSRHGLKEKVQFLGGLSVTQMKEALAKVSALTLLSYQETAPLIIAEAMAAGVPVVASKICGIPHMITDGVDGFVVDPDDFDSAANHLVSILKDPALAGRLRSSAKHHAELNHHPLVVARKTMDAYKDVLGKRG